MLSRLPFLCFLMACAGRPLNLEQKISRSFTVFAMGTLWQFDVRSPSFRPEFEMELKSRAENTLEHYEAIFSDWLSDSELRQLESRDLTRWQKASPEFLLGLEWAGAACRLSHERFDITIGAVIWKALAKPVGCTSLQLRPGEFRFVQHPKRLTFDGMIKGAVVAILAREFRLSYPQLEMRINGGGGDLFLSRSFAKEEGRALADVTLSNSFTQQTGRQHIFDPQVPGRSFALGARVVCTLPPTDLEAWPRLGALGDAMSTALTVDPTLDFQLSACKINLKKESVL